MESVAINKKLERKLNIIALIVSAVVLLLVGGMRKIKLDLGMDFGFLPPVHSTLNAITAVLLGYAYVQIKRKNIERHRKARHFMCLHGIPHPSQHLRPYPLLTCRTRCTTELDTPV